MARAEHFGPAPLAALRASAPPRFAEFCCPQAAAGADRVFLRQGKAVGNAMQFPGNLPQNLLTAADCMMTDADSGKAPVVDFGINRSGREEIEDGDGLAQRRA